MWMRVNPQTMLRWAEHYVTVRLAASQPWPALQRVGLLGSRERSAGLCACLLPAPHAVCPTASTPPPHPRCRPLLPPPPLPQPLLPAALLAASLAGCLALFRGLSGR